MGFCCFCSWFFVFCLLFLLFLRGFVCVGGGGGGVRVGGERGRYAGIYFHAYIN